jgi:hypothetical protein
MTKIAGGGILSRAATSASFWKLKFFTKMLIKNLKKYLEKLKIEKILRVLVWAA